jgi:hypothetical protein
MSTIMDGIPAQCEVNEARDTRMLSSFFLAKAKPCVRIVLVTRLLRTTCARDSLIPLT